MASKRKDAELIRGHVSHRRTEGDYMGVLLCAVTLEDCRDVVIGAKAAASAGCLEGLLGAGHNRGYRLSSKSQNALIAANVEASHGKQSSDISRCTDGSSAQSSHVGALGPGRRASQPRRPEFVSWPGGMAGRTS